MTEKKNNASRGSTRAGSASKPKDKRDLRDRPVLLAVLGGLLALILIPLGVFLVAYSTVDVPEPGELTTAQVSSIYASDSATDRSGGIASSMVPSSKYAWATRRWVSTITSMLSA